MWSLFLYTFYDSITFLSRLDLSKKWQSEGTSTGNIGQGNSGQGNSGQGNSGQGNSGQGDRHEYKKGNEQ